MSAPTYKSPETVIPVSATLRPWRSFQASSPSLECKTFGQAVPAQSPWDSRNMTVGLPSPICCRPICLAAPFVVAVVSSSLVGFDRRLEFAAMNLGAGPWATFWQVTFPLIRPAVLAGAFFAFIASFDELIVALFVSGSTAITLPRRMWDELRFEIDPTIAAVSTLLVALTLALFLASEALRRRGEWLRAER